MHRRDFLFGAIAGGTVGSIGTLAVTSGTIELPAEVPDASAIPGNDTYAMEQSLSGGLDRLVWHDDGTVSLYFNQDHSYGGVLICHEYNTEGLRERTALYAEDAPKYDGPLEFNLLSRIRNGATPYPTRVFYIEARDYDYWLTGLDETGTADSMTVGVPKQFDIPVTNE